MNLFVLTMEFALCFLNIFFSGNQVQTLSTDFSIFCCLNKIIFGLFIVHSQPSLDNRYLQIYIGNKRSSSSQKSFLLLYRRPTKFFSYNRKCIFHFHLFVYAITLSAVLYVSLYVSIITTSIVEVEMNSITEHYKISSM